MSADGGGGAARRDRRGRLATAVAFFVQGLCFAVVVTRVSVLQEKFHLSNGQLTIVLLIVPVIAGVGSVLAGPLAARHGSRTVLRVAQPLVCLTLPAIGFAATLGELYVAVGLFGLLLGAVDATMNMQGAITEKRYGYSVITAFYSGWSAAGILGGLWNAAAGKLGLPLGAAFAIAAAGGLAGSLVSGRLLFSQAEDVTPLSEAAAKAAGISIPWRPIALIGLAMGCMYIGDAAVSNFSSVYMSSVQHGSKAVLPLAFAAYQTMMVAGRAIGDLTVRRFGAAAVVRAGACVAVLGLAGVVLAPSPAVAIAAFAVTGLGYCVVPPQCFSATAKLDPTGSGIAISRVNLFNYAGFVLGAALVGGVAGVEGGPAGWRAAYAAPLVLTLVIAALARGFAPAPAAAAVTAAPLADPADRADQPPAQPGTPGDHPAAVSLLTRSTLWPVHRWRWGGSRVAESAAETVAEAPGRHGTHYKWFALSNTTLGMLAATVNGSIVIISLPAIFRGIRLDPLGPGNVSYLLWMLMGYLVVSAVLVVTLGRLGDIYGRVRMYNLGFAVFALGALALPFDPFTGPGGAMWLIGWRVLQAIGGAMLMANAPAILTDAFPASQRGTAMGINQIAGISGQFVGLLLGGVLAAVNWRLVFIVSVPIGLAGTVWSYFSLREIGHRTQARIDWLGNVTFALGLIGLLVGITYGIQPYGGHVMGWTSPLVLTGLIGGPMLLGLFCLIELRVRQPMFDLRLLRIRAFAAGNGATLLASIARGGLQFMLIIWLQGIWLILHGYRYADTPLWSGIYLLPLTFGFIVAGPVSGWLSDKHGARAFASGGLLVSAAAFGGLLLVPTNFSYPLFAALAFVSGAGMGLFSAPNAAAIMNSVPARQRGAASGMLATFQNSGFVLSIGVFFSLMIAGLAATLPATLTHGLTAQGVPQPIAHVVGALPPVGSLFAAFLGYNPVRTLLGPTGVLGHLPPAHAAVLTGKRFFPQLISQPFHHGLVIVFGTAMAVLVIAAGASALRGGRFVHEEQAVPEPGTAAPAALEGTGRA